MTKRTDDAGVDRPGLFAFENFGTGAQAHQYQFTYDHQKYVIWVWKGEYMQMGYGAEVGFYGSYGSPIAPGKQWWANPLEPEPPEDEAGPTRTHDPVAVDPRVRLEGVAPMFINEAEGAEP